jgi:hypothetical protein
MIFFDGGKFFWQYKERALNFGVDLWGFSRYNATLILPTKLNRPESESGGVKYGLLVHFLNSEKSGKFFGLVSIIIFVDLVGWFSKNKFQKKSFDFESIIVGRTFNC